VFDPGENLFPMDLDVLRRIDADTNLGALHAKHPYDDVRTDPDAFANSPREYQHLSLLARLEMTTIAGRGPFFATGVEEPPAVRSG
jgi:hypothetical protein